MPTIRTTTLDNGLTIVTERQTGMKSAGLCWTLPSGTAREAEHLQGLTSILADLLMRGAGELSSREQADAFDRLGVTRSASAQASTITVGATLLGERLRDALPLIVDTVVRPRLEEEHLGPVRDLALQSLASLRDDPQERVVLNLRDAHVAPPHNRSSYGTEAGVNAIGIDDVRTAHATGCVPGGSFLTCAGDVDHDALVDAITPMLDGWRGDAIDLAPIAPGGRGVVHEHQDTDQTHIGVVHDGPKAGDDEAWLERVATHVLSGGMSSRLFTEVREKRSLVYTVHARYGADRDYGRTTAYAGTTPERAQETLNVLLEELERINTPSGRVTQEEFDNAMVGITSRLVFSGESSGARARSLAGDMRVLGTPQSLDEKRARFDAITLDALNDYLGQRSLGDLTIASVGSTALETPVRSGA